MRLFILGVKGECMSLKKAVSKSLHYLRISIVCVTAFQFSLGGPLASPLLAQDHDRDHGDTASPIKHVIILIGENRSFDNLFATYVSPSGDSVKNLLSEGIIKADGTPGKHFKRAQQFQAVPPFKTSFYISLDGDDKTPYDTLPEPP